MPRERSGELRRDSGNCPEKPLWVSDYCPEKPLWVSDYCPEKPLWVSDYCPERDREREKPLGFWWLSYPGYYSTFNDGFAVWPYQE